MQQRRAFGVTCAAFVAALLVTAPAGARHGEPRHIPPSQANVDLVGQVQVRDVAAEQVADVATYRDTAFLAGWSPLCTVAPNFAGGFWSIDIANPSAPRELGFTPMVRGSYLTEGMHAMRLTVPGFTGDVMIASREVCGNAGTTGKGGFVIYDVTNPAAPVLLGESGDTGVRGALFNSSHSAFGWDTGDNAYVVIVDNQETTDIDIFDITDPRNPRLIRETGIADWPAAQDNLAYGSQANVHDMIVRRVEGRWEMLASYWDAGYVRVDMTNPANPTYIADSDFAARDPFFPSLQPEGNAHEAEWDRCPEEGVRSTFPCGDVRYILAADEDFSIARPTFDITTGANAGAYGSGEFSFTPPLERMFPNGVTGPTVFGGSGCAEDINGNGMSDRDELPLASSITVPAGQRAMAVFERGTCFFSDKIRTAELRGYQVAIIGNHHAGSGNGAFPDAFLCGGQGSPVAGTAAALCVGHRSLHLLFNDAPQYTGPSTGAGADVVPIGTVGNAVRSRGGVFDGWGYLHLINADTMQHIDQYAVPQSIDPRFAFDFGDLTIHEITTDPTGDVGYIAWYSAGFRVVDYSAGRLEEVGHYVDPAGSDIWGVELNVRRDGRLFALASDRSYGLQIFRFGTDLRPTKISSPRTTRVGRTFTYRIRVANDGTIAETNPVVRDRLPRGVRFVRASATQGRCTYRSGTRTVVCNLGRIVNDAGTAFVNITVRATRAGTFRNTAVVNGVKAEYDIGNNRARVATRIRPAPRPARPPALTGRPG
jgi:uncharacterized repeat protein (TIGR01451 family)